MARDRKLCGCSEGTQCMHDAPRIPTHSCGCPVEIDSTRCIHAKETGALKFDAQKLPVQLGSVLFNEAVAHALGVGAVKYGEDNWRKGLKVRRVLGAAKRHIDAFLDGEDWDPTDLQHHLGAAGACLTFALETSVTNPSMDDRYEFTKAQKQRMAAFREKMHHRLETRTKQIMEERNER